MRPVRVHSDPHRIFSTADARLRKIPYGHYVRVPDDFAREDEQQRSTERRVGDVADTVTTRDCPKKGKVWHSAVMLLIYKAKFLHCSARARNTLQRVAA